MPNAIIRLDPCVVNKIAAGEVIQRPASALKEMLENSLDAGASQISVVVKEGGNKLLQITDTGHGIRKDDLPVLCHRHTTSKLASFEDLETINTLGFRGEALCSISFVSNLSITTMTEGSIHGYRVAYKDSEMLPPGPKPVAAVRGTTITVEDLFYNVPTRRKALKSAAEEYARVMDVVTRYALMASGRCAFSCKRQGEARADVLTVPGASTLDNIRALYGAAVANNLLPISLKVGREPTTAVGMDEGVCLVLQGFISSASYAAKRTQMVLFINGRAVDCGPMRRALEAVYAQLLPKASKPFLYLDLKLPPRHVDVNMHPTKREVGFIHQEEITSSICEAVGSILSTSNTSRTLATLKVPNTTMPGHIPRPSQTQTMLDGSGTQSKSCQHASQAATNAMPASYRPEKLVRVDHMTQSLDAFFPGIPSQSQQRGDAAEQGSAPSAAAAAALAGSFARKRRRGKSSASQPAAPQGDFMSEGFYSNAEAALIRVQPEDQEGDLVGTGEEAGAGPSVRKGAGGMGMAGSLLLSECLHSSLDSIQGLAAEVDAANHAGLAELLRGHVFVGMADDTRALLQFRTKLYIVDLAPLSREFFYQQVLAQFEAVENVMVLDPAPDVRELMAMALVLEQAKGAWEPGEHDGESSEHKLCELVAQMLMEKSAMLEEYLGMRVDKKGHLCSVPLFLPGWQPDLGGLCDLVLGLARDVVWDQEQMCFMTLAQVLADFLALKPPLAPAGSSHHGSQLPLPAHKALGEQVPFGSKQTAATAEPTVLAPPTTASLAAEVGLAAYHTGSQGRTYAAQVGCLQGQGLQVVHEGRAPVADARSPQDQGTLHGHEGLDPQAAVGHGPTADGPTGSNGQKRDGIASCNGADVTRGDRAVVGRVDELLGRGPMDWQKTDDGKPNQHESVGTGQHQDSGAQGPDDRKKEEAGLPSGTVQEQHQGWGSQVPAKHGLRHTQLSSASQPAPLPTQRPDSLQAQKPELSQGEGVGGDAAGGDAAMVDGNEGTEENTSIAGHSTGSSRGERSSSGGMGNEALAPREWAIKHALLPAMRFALRPSSKRATDGTCVEIAALERLYRIFERC